MAEEQPTVEDRVLNQLARMEEKLEAQIEQVNGRLVGIEGEIKTLRENIHTWQLDSERRFSRLEGSFDQMDKRMANVEQLQRWAIGIMFTSWFTIIGLILAKI